MKMKICQELVSNSVLALIEKMKSIFKSCFKFEDNLFSRNYNRSMIGSLLETQCIPFIEHFMKLGLNSMTIDNAFDWITKLSHVHLHYISKQQ